MKSSLVLVLLIVAVVIAVESSELVRASLLRPRRGLLDDCFTSRRDERPFYQPLLKYFNKAKDMFVKGFNAVAASAREYKLLPPS